MCRSQDEGGRRCACDSSAARQSRRVAAKIRSSVTPHERPEPVQQVASPTAPSIEVLKEESSKVRGLIQEMQAGERTPEEVEPAITALGQQILARVEADAITPELQQEIDSSKLVLDEYYAKDDALVQKVLQTEREKKRLNELLRDRLMTQSVYDQAWDAQEDKRTALEEERQALKEEYLASVSTAAKHKEALSQAYRDVLGQLRPMGGELTTLSDKSHKKSAQVLQGAMRNFPSSWVQASNELPGVIRVKKTEARAHYVERKKQKESKQFTGKKFFEAPEGWEPPKNDPLYEGWIKLSDVPAEDPEAKYFIKDVHRDFYAAGAGRETWVTPEYESKMAYDDTPPKGRGWKKVTYPGRYWDKDKGQYYGEPKTVWIREKKTRETLNTSNEAELSIAHAPSDRTVGSVGEDDATHEFSHRVEHALPHVRQLEEAFLVRRTTLPSGEREKYQVYRIGELVRPDNFAHRYMGKVYSNGSREILSTGTEALFNGRYGGLVGYDGYRRDDDMRSFILGTMASA